MSVVTEVKDVIVDAKKKYNKEKYIDVLEKQIDKMQHEIERLNTQIEKLENNKFVLNSDHIELFKLFRDNEYIYYEDDIREYVKKSIDLEIALSELIENGYFQYIHSCVIDYRNRLTIPESVRIEFLKFMKRQN